MRRSKADKEVTHEKIVTAAARRFREEGIQGIGLSGIMKDAGLKSGGFYKHFESRDDLVIEALAEAFKDLDAIEQAAPDLVSLLDVYLSESHRDSPGTGCAITALAGDARHASTGIRTVFTERVKHTFNHYGEKLGVEDKDTRRQKAILLFSAAVGGLTLARAVNDKVLSREILSSLRTQLTDFIKTPRGAKEEALSIARRVRRTSDIQRVRPS